MTKLLSEGEVADLRERGYHFPVDALSESEVAEFRGKLEDYEAEAAARSRARCATAATCCSPGSTT